MLLWSDAPESAQDGGQWAALRPGGAGGAAWGGAGHGAAWACGEIVRELIRRVRPMPGRVLLIGPHPEDFVDWLVARSRSVAVAVRSYPDAVRLGARHAGRAGFAVYCGQLAKLGGLDPFDVVLALDGFERVHSAESPYRPWRETLAEVAALVAPGGTLLLSTRNDLGIESLVEARPHERTDADWHPRGLDHTRPNGHQTLAAELDAHGLLVDDCYAAYPAAGAPRALFSVETLARGRTLPDAVTVAACARGYHGRAVVADPVQLTRKAFRHGLAARLAPAWVTVARKQAPGRTGGPALPAALLEDDVCAPPWTLVQELARGEQGKWVRHVPPASRPFALDRVHRDPALLSGPIPEGRVLDEVLLTACAYDDIRAIRERLRHLAGWLSRWSDAGMVPGELAFATTDNLVWDGERLDLIDPSWALADALPTEVVLTRTLWRFAVRLLGSGHHHPWPWSVDADRLTATLVAISGFRHDRRHLERAKALDREIGTTLGVGATAAADAPESYRQVLAGRERLRDTLTAAQARIDRLEVKLTHRERELRKTRSKLRAARRRIAGLRRRLGFRLMRRARALTRPLTRPVRRRLRAARRIARG
ncbi:hypothetical protein GCM10023259_069760 [Thermocatellispora tengchongensis]